jgi:hypothetical protein
MSIPECSLLHCMLNKHRSTPRHALARHDAGFLDIHEYRYIYIHLYLCNSCCMVCFISTAACPGALPPSKSPISATTLPTSKLNVPAVSPVKRATNGSRTLFTNASQTLWMDKSRTLITNKSPIVLMHPPCCRHQCHTH